MLPWLRMSPVRIQFAFLGGIKRTIPRSRSASGRAPRIGLVQDAVCGTGAQRRLVLDETEHGAMLFTSAAMRGQCPVSPADQQRSCCDDHLNPPNTPRSSSAAVAVTRACVPRWVRSVTHTTMPCARASSPRSNANCLIAAGSRRRSRQEARCSPSSRVSTIRDAGTHRSDTSHRSTTNAGITQRPSIAAHTSLPPCSRPSRTSPSGGRKKRPSLTATARDGRATGWAGTKEWLRRGPNQRMARYRRTICSQPAYPDHKLSPLHQTGASPVIACLQGLAPLSIDPDQPFRRSLPVSWRSLWRAVYFRVRALATPVQNVPRCRRCRVSGPLMPLFNGLRRSA